jgi:hypothetical protein
MLMQRPARIVEERSVSNEPAEVVDDSQVGEAAEAAEVAMQDEQGYEEEEVKYDELTEGNEVAAMEIANIEVDAITQAARRTAYSLFQDDGSKAATVDSSVVSAVLTD